MASFITGLTITDVAAVHRGFLEAIAAAEREDQRRRTRGLPPTNQAVVRQLRQLQQKFQADLRNVALRASNDATAQIRSVFHATAKRDDTGVSPHLQDNIVSMALGQFSGFETGAVGVAREEDLDRTPYWRAQEYGTGTAEVGSITTAATGRRLRGFFFGSGFSGFPSPPNPQEFRQHPVFRPGMVGGNSRLGLPVGIVTREIEGRHFIRDGADAAYRRWRSQIDALQSEYVRALLKLKA